MSEAEKLGEAVSTEGCRPETAPVEPTSAGPAWTAGPWRVDPGYNCDVQDAAGKWEVSTTHPGVLNRGLCDPSRAQANARLISAAPDLYEALEAVLEGLERRFPQVSRAEMDACERAHESLAKARGQ